MANTSLTKQFEDLPQIAKILIHLFLGWIVGGIYRIIRYTETKNTTTLVAGLLGCFTGIGNIVTEVVDLVTTILYNKITVLAD